ncbi:hypothetical protein P4S91_04635 [Aneurinibacillus aneurinilyticus]|uniref:hypothetical protein n=1 Tax=Aneurinibacillus aneurinilyticus TaxID=1391 RepID=UPI002E23F151|nr:hypothetical protein [Aneurinibacillus aneurinilyticus]MED0722218.1 hypothetical protein [Aneurinibacillus aneurinilyticus]
MRWNGIRIGTVSRYLFPNYSACVKCNTTWNLVKMHKTKYREETYEWGIIRRAVGPLCEKCWSGLSIEERLLFYEVAFLARDEREWQKIKAAVLDGK